VERIERTVTTPDGRILAVQEAGDPAGRPVVVHLGTPHTRNLYGPHAADAAGRGLRLISYDRPGYGGSTPQPGRTYADCAADVRAICAALGLSRIAPYDAAGLDWFDGMGKDNADACRLHQADLAAARARVDADREVLLRAAAADMAEGFSSLFSGADAAVFTGELADWILSTASPRFMPGCLTGLRAAEAPGRWLPARQRSR
jgi:pimeloyl-ACP methyl ester carboxylesterase